MVSGVLGGFCGNILRSDQFLCRSANARDRIRIAVGAEPRQILLMILRRAFVLVAIGIIAGLPLAVGSLRFAASLLYGVSPLDSVTVAGVMILLTVVGISAGLVPARNAARTDPCNALRQD
jgi:ABC-type antimicrobial peptide transport system permease subunit